MLPSNFSQSEFSMIRLSIWGLPSVVVRSFFRNEDALTLKSPVTNKEDFDYFEDFDRANSQMFIEINTDSASLAIRGYKPSEIIHVVCTQIFWKINISNPLRCTQNLSFTENFAYALNGWRLESRWKKDLDITFTTYASWEYLA